MSQMPHSVCACSGLLLCSPRANNSFYILKGFLKKKIRKKEAGRREGRRGKEELCDGDAMCSWKADAWQTENHNHRKLTSLITWTTDLSNSVKLWAMLCRATQDGQVMVESSDKSWSTGEGNSKPLQYACLENPMNSIKRQKDRTLKDELCRSVGAQYATGEQWRNNSRKNEETEPKQKQHPVVDVTGDGWSLMQYCKEPYCIGTWNVRSMSESKLAVVKQEMARVNVDILGISELKWTGMGECNSDDHYMY